MNSSTTTSVCLLARNLLLHLLIWRQNVKALACADQRLMASPLRQTSHCARHCGFLPPLSFFFVAVGAIFFHRPLGQPFRWTPGTVRTKISRDQIDRRPAHVYAWPCARVTASLGRDHETSSIAKLDRDRSATGPTSFSVQKSRFFFSNEQAPSLPPLKRTSFVWNKNADKWRRPLKCGWTKCRWTRSIRHCHNQQKNTSPDSARGGGGVRAIFSVSAWTHTEPLLREMKLCSIDVRFKLKLLIHTYRCTHALASSLLCQQCKLRSHSNSTHSTTRSQLTNPFTLHPQCSTTPWHYFSTFH